MFAGRVHDQAAACRRPGEEDEASGPKVSEDMGYICTSLISHAATDNTNSIRPSEQPQMQPMKKRHYSDILAIK